MTSASERVRVRGCSARATARGERGRPAGLEPLEGEDEDGRHGLGRDLAVPQDVAVLEAEVGRRICAASGGAQRQHGRRGGRGRNRDAPLEVGSPAWPGLGRFWLAVTVARRSLRRTMTALCRWASVSRCERGSERQLRDPGRRPSKDGEHGHDERDEDARRGSRRARAA